MFTIRNGDIQVDSVTLRNGYGNPNGGCINSKAGSLLFAIFLKFLRSSEFPILILILVLVRMVEQSLLERTSLYLALFYFEITTPITQVELTCEILI